MMILFMVFVVQFSVSCACLALNKEQQVCLFCLCLTTVAYIQVSFAYIGPRSNMDTCICVMVILMV